MDCSLVLGTTDATHRPLLKGTIEAWLSSTGIPWSAVADMIPDSPALRRLQSSTVKTHAIIGTAPAAAGSADNKFYKMISRGVFKTADALFGETNDLVVGASSQAGGRSVPATASHVTNVIHFHGSSLIGEADSVDVRNYSIGALDLSTTAFH